MDSINSISPSRRRPGFPFVAQLALGIWLLLSPFFIRFEIGASLWNTVLCGAALVLLALLRAGLPGASGLRFAMLLPGAWLIIAPFLFEYLSGPMFWNSIIVGVVSLAIAIATRGAVALPPTR